MLEEKKNEADREMKRRRASIIERSKTIFKEQQKKDGNPGCLFLCTFGGVYCCNKHALTLNLLT